MYLLRGEYERKQCGDRAGAQVVASGYVILRANDNKSCHEYMSLSVQK